MESLLSKSPHFHSHHTSSDLHKSPRLGSLSEIRQHFHHPKSRGPSPNPAAASPEHLRTSPKLSDLKERFQHSRSRGVSPNAGQTAVRLEPEEEFKIALIGDTGSGRSSIMTRVSASLSIVLWQPWLRSTSSASISLKSIAIGTPLSSRPRLSPSMVSLAM